MDIRFVEFSPKFIPQKILSPKFMAPKFMANNVDWFAEHFRFHDIDTKLKSGELGGVGASNMGAVYICVSIP